ncbi:MAG: hypothetical protein FWH26_00045 [Oscillospiraceae bacterium]|nr:hypothetical protein [Oscillospiraceae bacterium]
MSKNNFFKAGMAIFEQGEPEAQAAAAPAPAQETRLLTDIVTKIPAKKRGVASTYYIDKTTAQAVEREAKRRGINKSKLVDEVLKRVFIDG